MITLIFMMIFCAIVTIRLGAVSVLKDNDSHTWNMKVEEIKVKIMPRTNNVMKVHL